MALITNNEQENIAEDILIWPIFLFLIDNEATNIDYIDYKDKDYHPENKFSSDNTLNNDIQSAKCRIVDIVRTVRTPA